MVAAYKLEGIGVRAKKETLRELVYGYFLKRSVSWARRHWRSLLWSLPVFLCVNVCCSLTFCSVTYLIVYLIILAKLTN